MLPKENRIQENKDFKHLFKNSKSISTTHLSLKVKITEKDSFCRFGFIISNKVNKRATRRNALKRQLREISKGLIFTLVKGYDVVVIVRKDFNYPYNQEEIKTEFYDAIKKIGLSN